MIRVVPLDQEILKPAFELATEIFIRHSTLHQALGIGLDAYRDYLHPSFVDMINDELSVVAIDEATEKLIGCLIACDFYKVLETSPNASGLFKPLEALTNALCKQYRQKRSIGPGEVTLVDMGAVVESASGGGVYQKLRDFAQKGAKQAGFSRVVGELSSCATQHVVLNRLGHQNVAEIRFQEFELDGVFPFSSITEPPSIILAEGIL